MSKIFILILFLAGSVYSFAGSQEKMPARNPLVLGLQEICSESWMCRNADALTSVWDATARGERPLRIASYNVHKCDGMDFRRDPARIAEVIKSLDADIVSLQEVLSDPGEAPSAQLRYLAEKTGMYAAVAGPTKQKKDGRYGNALLSRFPITEVRLHDISFSTYEPRGIIDADILIGGQVLRVLATHFGLWPSERNRQADRLLELLPERPDQPLIVMGDMNGWVPGSPVLRRLKKRLGEPMTRRTFPATFPILPLDRIWILPAYERHHADMQWSPLARIASDHLPVVAAVYIANLTSRISSTVLSQ